MKTSSFGLLLAGSSALLLLSACSKETEPFVLEKHQNAPSVQPTSPSPDELNEAIPPAEFDLLQAMGIEEGFTARRKEPTNRDYPFVEEISLIHPKILAVTFLNGERVPGQFVPYVEQPGDVIEIQKEKPYSRTLIREGAPAGYIVGPDGSVLRLLDSFVGVHLEARDFFFENLYLVQYENDPNYSLPKEPLTTSIKSEPIDYVQYPGWRFDFVNRTTLFLHLPAPLQSGMKYTLRSQGPLFQERIFSFNDAETRTEAIHVSQAGFRPDDPVKFATLSGWIGTGGPLEYEEMNSFQLIDEADGQTVYEGSIVPFKPQSGLDDPHPQRSVNVNLTDTYRMDFSSFRKPGSYRVRIPGLGVSFPFPVHEDVWTSLFQVSAKGIFFHRASLEVTSAYGGDFIRPLNFHPDMGKVAVRTRHQTNPLTFNGKKNTNQETAFDLLEEGAGTERVTEAYGGHFDAGDSDRRTPHLKIPLYYMELYRFNPEFFKDLTWNIPESGNGLPDILDEAKWGIDIWKRLQSEDGGVPSWIESSAHPRAGEPSWLDSLPLYLTVPEAQASYHYAAAAARFAQVVHPLDAEMSDDYLSSARRAFSFAEKRFQSATDRSKIRKPVLAYRNLAAVELLAATGESFYHDIFLEDTFFKTDDASLMIWKNESEGGVNLQADAALAYAFLELPVVDDTIRSHAKNAILRNADWAARYAFNTSNGYSKFEETAHIGWKTMGAPQAINLIRALYLTGDETYLKAAITATQFMLGNNGDNIVLTTGVGSRRVENPLHIDYRKGNLPVPPGISVYGPWDTKRFDFWSTKLFKQYAVLIPEYENWPVSEAYFDMAKLLAGQAEYTIQQTMVQAGYYWGGLAAWQNHTEN